MTQNTIHILPEHLANQIAAGEVVQRPESVVKELVENAIDAGATSISVFVKEGGLRSIQVVDNGCGMSRDDLELSVVRHATSKIASQDDLQAIQTLGFRGEALASIAAVAEVEITTARTEDDAGWTLYVRPGMPAQCRPSNVRVGTSITISNLFATVPARRKFLKSPLTEFRYISETLQRLALACPHVSFVLYDADTVVLHVEPESPLNRVCNVLKSYDASQFIAVDCRENGVWIRGYLGNASVSRRQRSGQMLYLNGRSIQSRSLAYAVAQCYQFVHSENEHPVFVLWLDVDPERIDVNIHPQKHEVKFDDERSVFLAIQQAVTNALSAAQLIPAVSPLPALVHTPLHSLKGQPQGHVAVNRVTGEILSSADAGASFDSSHSKGPFDHQRQKQHTSEHHHSFLQLMASETATSRQVLFMDKGLLFCRHEDGIMVVRLLPALERIFYEQMISHEQGGRTTSDQLLFPVSVVLDASSQATLNEFMVDLCTLGFEVSLESDSVIVKAVPSFVSAGDEEEALRDALLSFADVTAEEHQQRRQKVVIQTARSRAVKAISSLGIDHAQQIVEDLRQCTKSHVSPSGLPTYTILTFDEIQHRLQ